MKTDNKFDRVKYIRALEHFANSAISILKRDDFDEELFKNRVTKNLQARSLIQKSYLDRPYTKALETFVGLVASFETKELLLKEANRLEKLKKSKSYKKEKHKNKKFDEY